MQAPKQKKVYVKPTLTTYGSVETLTLISNGGGGGSNQLAVGNA